MVIPMKTIIIPLFFSTDQGGCVTNHIEGNFFKAVNELSAAGYNKTTIKKLVEQALPAISKNETIRVATIRNVKMAIEYISGVEKHNIINNHGVKDSFYRECIYKGLEEIREALALPSRYGEPFPNFKRLDDDIKREWAEKGRYLLSKL